MLVLSISVTTLENLEMILKQGRILQADPIAKSGTNKKRLTKCWMNDTTWDSQVTIC